MRRINRSLTMGATFLVAACHSYKPLLIPVNAVGKTVSVEFSAPRTLVAVRGTLSDSVLKLVSTFRGRVISVSGDTLNISLLRITDGAQDHEAQAGMIVAVAPDPSVAVDVLEFDEAKTAALAGGTIYVAAWVAAILAFAALLRFLDSWPAER